MWKRASLIVWIAVFLFSISQIITYINDSMHTSSLYESIREVKDTSLSSVSQQTVRISYDEEHKQTSSPVPALPVIQEQFKPLLEVNADTVGWITVEDTPIDYPVVQTTDNDYYLEHDFTHKRASAGSIFMDFRNKPDSSSRNTILYGHYMRDGSMFKGLVKYSDQQFFEEHPMITYNTLYETIEWEVFSAYVTDTSFNYIQTDFRSKRDYANFLSELQAKSLFKNDISLSADDQILTLSTCSYDFEDARFVVHAKRKEASL